MYLGTSNLNVSEGGGGGGLCGPYIVHYAHKALAKKTSVLREAIWLSLSLLLVVCRSSSSSSSGSSSSNSNSIVLSLLWLVVVLVVVDVWISSNCYY